MKGLNKLINMNVYAEIINQNHVVIHTSVGKMFLSYGTKICAIVKDDDVTYLSTSYKASRTTMKYLCEFLGVHSIRDVDTMIKEGKAKFENF